MDLLPQFLANGLVIGSFYALSALGLTLILGLMRVVNFAHGELYMLGGVLGWWVTTALGLDFLTGLALVALIMGVFGWLVDRVLIERIRGQGEEPGILLTIGLSIFLANTALLVVGTAPLKVAGPVSSGPVFLGPIVVTQDPAVRRRGVRGADRGRLSADPEDPPGPRDAGDVPGSDGRAAGGHQDG